MPLVVVKGMHQMRGRITCANGYVCFLVRLLVRIEVTRTWSGYACLGAMNGVEPDAGCGYSAMFMCLGSYAVA